MTSIVCDIDGVLALGHHLPYHERRPNHAAIARLRLLKAADVQITLWTSRHWNDEKVTTEWLSKWAVPYDSLMFGKPRAAMYVDDRASLTIPEPQDLLRSRWAAD